MRLFKRISSKEERERLEKERQLQLQKRDVPVVRIEILSDTVCPYCYIMKHRLEKAVREFEGKLQFEVTWLAFMLYPTAPVNGMSRQAFMYQKFKGQGLVIMQKLKELCDKEGIPLIADGKIGQTFNSHRLVAFAGHQSLHTQNALVDELFRAYFAEGKFLNDKEVLREAAVRAGVQRPEECIDDPECCAQQVRYELDVRARGIVGVPHLIINGKDRMSGAQEVQSFVSLFRKYLESGSA